MSQWQIMTMANGLVIIPTFAQVYLLANSKDSWEACEVWVIIWKQFGNNYM